MLGTAALVPADDLLVSPSTRHDSRNRNIVVMLVLVAILGPITQLRPTILTLLVDTAKIGQPPRIRQPATQTRLRARGRVSHQVQMLARREGSRNPSRRPSPLIRRPHLKLSGYLACRWCTHPLPAHAACTSWRK
jgi:hypothetical protein